MTHDQLEAAARELAKMRGLDPDAEAGPGMPYPSTRRTEWKWARVWEAHAEEVERFAEVGTAIAAALQQAEPKKRRKNKVFQGETSNP